MVGTIYRRSNSTTENDEKLLEAIECFSKSLRDNLLLLGDFSWPDINWQYRTTTNLNKPDSKLLNILQKTS